MGKSLITYELVSNMKTREVGSAPRKEIHIVNELWPKKLKS